MRQFSELPPLSLYIHLPWCIRKCPYCDFNSHEHKSDIPEAEYVQALLRDLEQEMPDIWGRTVVSIFLGGGTPSLFSAKSLDTLLSGVRALTAISPDTEITMEANPGTFEQEKFKDFRGIGINRLSIGVQSFNDTALQELGRVHNGGEARRAIDIAHSAGFDNLNIDLMFGLPKQDLKSAAEDVSTAISLQPEHISYYELTLEPNTLFAKYPPNLPDADTVEQYQEQGMQLLADSGYSRYEVSAFAQPKRQCLHNTNYWQFGDYVGIGAGAHGKLSFANTGKILRRSKQRHPTRYLSDASTEQRVSTQTEISAEDTAIEFMMNALRLSEGFSIPLFQQHTGMPLDHWQACIDAAQAEGLLEQSGLSLRATEAGFRYLNNLLGHFMPADEPNSEPKDKRYPVIPLIQDAKNR